MKVTGPLISIRIVATGAKVSCGKVVFTRPVILQEKMYNRSFVPSILKSQQPSLV